MIFTEEEIQYYSRQNLVSVFSVEKQQLLKNARVVVVGAGGLGTTVLQILARAGVGNIGVVDYDKIEISNIHRQILYTYHDIGQYKVDVASTQLQKINPFIAIHEHNLRVSASTIFDLFSNYDIVVDASDNFETKYLINDACVLYNKTLVFAAVQQTEGQVAVFNYNNNSTNYRDIFPIQPKQWNDCNTIGVINTAVNIIGTLQANEVLKIILHLDDVLFDKMLTYDVLSGSQQVFGITEKQAFSYTDLAHHHVVKQISEKDLATMKPEEYRLIDVRSAYEHKKDNGLGVNIPLETIEEKLMEFNKSTLLIFYCNSQNRSRHAAQIAENIGFKQVFTLAK